MKTVDRQLSRHAPRTSVLVFVLLSALPIALTIQSFRPFFPLPSSVYPSFEVAFHYLVYLPVSTVRMVLFEPIGLGVLYTTPIVQEAVILGSLLAMYYLLSLLLVATARRIQQQWNETAPS